MVIQITKSETFFLNIDKDLKKLNSEFNKNHHVKLLSFLESSLLSFIQTKISQAGFYEFKHSTVDAVDEFLIDESINNTLNFLLNDKKLFQFIEQVTSCPKIGSFYGRTCKMSANHYDDWHSDMIDNRMIALSINLSTEVYAGGILQIRNEKTKEILYEVANAGFGDAIIFKIDPGLNHRVTEVKNGTSRIVFAGWFRSKPEYRPIFGEIK